MISCQSTESSPHLVFIYLILLQCFPPFVLHVFWLEKCGQLNNTLMHVLTGSRWQNGTQDHWLVPYWVLKIVIFPSNRFMLETWKRRSLHASFTHFNQDPAKYLGSLSGESGGMCFLLGALQYLWLQNWAHLLPYDMLTIDWSCLINEILRFDGRGKTSFVICFSPRNWRRHRDGWFRH